LSGTGPCRRLLRCPTCRTGWRPRAFETAALPGEPAGAGWRRDRGIERPAGDPHAGTFAGQHLPVPTGAADSLLRRCPRERSPGQRTARARASDAAVGRVLCPGVRLGAQALDVAGGGSLLRPWPADPGGGRREDEAPAR